MEKVIPELWAHQKQAVKKARDYPYFGLLFEPGVGKTSTTITILREKYAQSKQVIPTLILCPPVVIGNWKKEFSIWSKIPASRIYPLVGSQKERIEILKTAPRDSIFITNYESLNMDKLFLELCRVVKDGVLVLDESHKVKSVTAKRTKKAIELADLATYRYILTGTPILNSLMDVFSQFRVLDRGQRFGKNFFTFRARYFTDKNKFMPRDRHFPDWVPLPNAANEIKELMDPISMYVEKESCLSLPPFVRKTVEVEMSKEQVRLYEEMKRDLVATFKMDDGSHKYSVAELALTKALRLQQIVSGHVRVEEDEGEVRTLKIKDNPRKKALKELLEDLAPYHKVLVWAVFRDNFDDIREVCEELELGYEEIHGDVKDKDKAAENFRSKESVRVMIGHPGSGGIGLNLVEASYMIYYSRNFSLEMDIQSEARAYRGGSERHASITRIDLVTPGTIDELVLKALEAKTAISNSVLKEMLV